MTKEALKHLKAITEAFGPDAGIELDQKAWSKLHNAIKEALAQPEYDYKDLYEKEKRKSAMWLSKYEEVAGPAPKVIPMAQPHTTPPQRKPLTDEQIETIWRRVQANDFHDCVQPFARAIEAAHGIKENT